MDDISKWEWTSSLSDGEAWQRSLLESWGRWKALSPFFASQGLYLYEYVHGSSRYARPPAHPKSSNSESEQLPWARRAYEREEDLDFIYMQAVRVWPARDGEGHEVMIRLASGPMESEELKVIRRLNTPEARSDKRNHTIPILNTLTFQGFVFVVMPRRVLQWHALSFHPWIKADSISELLDLAEEYYGALEFLHEKRIAHRDICSGNCVMNILSREGRNQSGLRKRGEVHYAFIDFDASNAFPEDSDLDSICSDRVMRRAVRSLRLQPGSCNPFKDDVLALTDIVEHIVRVAYTVVPEIGAFFDGILKVDYEHCPSASEALRAFRMLRAKLTEAQLKAGPEGSSYNPRTGRNRGPLP